MGSQGSQTMNVVFKEMIRRIDSIDYQIVFVSGKNEYQTFMQGIEKLPDHVFVEDYINQSELLPYVDLIIARAGASTITEIVAFDLPSILVQVLMWQITINISMQKVSQINKQPF